MIYPVVPILPDSLCVRLIDLFYTVGVCLNLLTSPLLTVFVCLTSLIYSAPPLLTVRACLTSVSYVPVLPRSLVCLSYLLTCLKHLPAIASLSNYSPLRMFSSPGTVIIGLIVEICAQLTVGYYLCVPVYFSPLR